MIEKFNKMDNKKKIIIVFIVTIIIIISVILLSNSTNKDYDYDSLKEDSTNDFVYTVDSEKSDGFFVYVPYINLKGSSIENINEEIDSYMEEFINGDMIRSNYEYEINGKVLSLVIKTIDYGSDDIPLIYFKTYNINLSNGELISDEELLSSYNLTIDDVSSSIEKQFKYFYEEIIKQGYQTEEEDYSYEAFLENRDVENYTDDISYSIEKGKLVVYKPFVIYSILGEEEYFKEDSFRFIISK